MTQKLYYALLTIAVLFWGSLALNALFDSPPAQAIVSPPFAACGIDVSAHSETYDENTGTYSFIVRMENTTAETQALETVEFRCRCPEGDGHERDGVQGVCSGIWPDDAGVHPDDRLCEHTPVTHTLTPGEVKEVLIEVGTPPPMENRHCGSLQVDLQLQTVTNGQGSVCYPPDAQWEDHNIGALWHTGIDAVGDVCPLDNDPPLCDITTIPHPPVGEAPLEVQFDGTGSFDPDGEVVIYEWEVSDGFTTDELGFTHTFTDPGSYTVSLRVRDNDWVWSDVCQVEVRTDEAPEEYVCNTYTQSCELETEVPVNQRGGSCEGILDDEACRYICNERTETCEIEASVPTSVRGDACAGEHDDEACRSGGVDEYVCDTRTESCQLEENVPLNYRGITCFGLHDSERCAEPDEYVCDTKLLTCELVENVPVQYRGEVCAGLHDDEACQPEDPYVCDTKLLTCELESQVPVQYRGDACDGPLDDEACREPEEYVCDTLLQVCELEENVPLRYRGEACEGLHDDEACQEEDEYVCDTRTQTCEMEENVPVQYRSGVCDGLHDDVACEEEQGPRFSQEPWVHHVSGQVRVYRKEVRVLSGGPVDDWQVENELRIVSESSNRLVIEARSGQCPTFSALIDGTLYGPYSMGCLP